MRPLIVVALVKFSKLTKMFVEIGNFQENLSGSGDFRVRGPINLCKAPSKEGSW